MTEFIEVTLTDEKQIHCFKVVFHVTIPGQTDRAPLEIYLHATQAHELFRKLGETILEYFATTSAELLRKVFANHEARELLQENLNMWQTAIVTGGEWAPEEVKAIAQKIDGFLAATSILEIPNPPAE